MERRRKVRLRAVLLVGALYYLVALPVGYVGTEGWLDCGHFGSGGRPKRSPQQAIRSAIMLYLADNPRGCPTPGELVDERYLDEAYAEDAESIEIRCKDGDVDVIGPGPPAEALRAQWKRRACRTLGLGAEIWALPFRGLIWAWQAAAGLFV
jgi:hypothetical protein